MRIARVLTRLNLGGPARQVLASDPLLAQRGHTLRIFCGTPQPGEGDLFDEVRRAGLDVVRVGGLKRGLAPAADLMARRRLKRMLSEFAPDILHTHASKAGTLGRQAVRGQERVGRVHTFHGHVLRGYFPAAISARLVAHERSLAKETDRILAVSHATADDLVELGVTEEDHLVVVPPGIEMQDLLAIQRQEGRSGESAVRGRLGIAPTDFLVGVVGRLAEVKRPARAIEVFRMLSERYPQLHLVFVGDGEERRSLERRIGELGEREVARVHMLGAVEAMTEVWAALDAALLVSRSEGLPVCLIEAAAAALPAVAEGVGGVEEIVAHERTGFVGHDVTELAFGLAQLMDSPEETLGMGQRARLRARSNFSADRLADRLEAVYEAVREERRCAS